MSLLKLEDISAGYDGAEVLHGISFTVNNSECVCIIGPNGCGKTTLLKVITQLIPSSGRVEINGMAAGKMKRRDIARKIAFMSQMTGVYFSYTVFETVMQGRYPHMNGVFGTASEKDRTYAEECLRAVGLYDQKEAEITKLSGGQLQRVFLARAFAQNPEIILLDEPTNHLDLKYQVELVEYLREWSRHDGHIVIGVLHDINLAIRLADKIMLMNNGKIEAFGGMEALSGGLLKKAYGMDVSAYMKSVLKSWEGI